GVPCRLDRQALQFFLSETRRARGPDAEGEPMPHTKSAKKNLRKAQKRRLQNRAVKRTIKTHCKRVLAAAEETPEKLREEFILAVRKLDKAAAKRVIHPNTAARKKSQLARLLNQKLPAGGTTPPPQQ